MSWPTMPEFRAIARVLCCLLVVNLVVRTTKRPFLSWIYQWILRCPTNSERCELFWQKSRPTEKLVWKLVDYIEKNQHI
ncbi:LADA_0G03510g1_1 [Lachancea dasiensis]|uniref:LADA_0G03510g1_1 n=1 Tax=Lachancea dasiensis TaxID=1072105 RepID=A0A1G4JRT1_9SACH|nr:LADA_0G03510g1_1 [Lachancea dasiensis]